jgi:hypothetical protein
VVSSDLLRIFLTATGDQGVRLALGMLRAVSATAMPRNDRFPLVLRHGRRSVVTNSTPLFMSVEVKTTFD